MSVWTIQSRPAVELDPNGAKSVQVLIRAVPNGNCSSCAESTDIVRKRRIIGCPRIVQFLVLKLLNRPATWIWYVGHTQPAIAVRLVGGTAVPPTPFQAWFTELIKLVEVGMLMT